MDEVETEHKNLDAQEVAFDAAAKAYMQPCRELLSSQQQELADEVDPRAGGPGPMHGGVSPQPELKTETGSTPNPAKLRERIAKIDMVEELIDLGLTIQLNNFKAQAAQVAADKAKAVADSAQGAARAAETGRQATDQTVEGLSRIRDQMSSIGETITRLNEQSQAVGDIVSTVTDLAEQSKESTKQVRGILTEVQKATGKAVLAAEQGCHKVEIGDADEQPVQAADDHEKQGDEVECAHDILSVGVE